MTYLANIAPICAIIGFLFIMIKTFVSDHIRLVMCVHVMVLSGVATLLYAVRQFVLFGDSLPPLAMSVIWAWIGFLNYIEYTSLKKRLH